MSAALDTDLGIGLIGCGRFGRVLADTVHDLDGARIVVVADQSAQAARDLAATFGVPAYEGYRPLLADPRVDTSFLLFRALTDLVLYATVRHAQWDREP